MMQNWRFPKLDGGVVSGFQNASMEHFRGSLVKSLVREICQNSIDAGEGRDVEVEFSSTEISMAQFPGYAEFHRAIDLAHAYWLEENSPNEVAFLEKAQTILRKDKLPILRISDFHTTGLTGSQRAGRNSRWGGLVRSEGLSNNTNTAGGSFGIGKAAQFVTSDLFTVFYSTYDEEGIQACSGVSKLLNFRQEDGTETQSTWYYDKDGTAISDTFNLDSEFNRLAAGYGTDVFIAAFNQEDWEKDAILAVICNFYYAIHTNRLTVIINGQRIDKERLPALFELYQSERMDYAYENYQALVSPETVWVTKEFYGGEVRIGILAKDDFHRQIDIIRSTGMKIYHKTFLQLPFAGVFLVVGDMPNAFMRKLEDPTHTKLSADRGPNHNISKPNARAFISNISKFIKECLSQLMEQDRQEEYDAGVGEYLPDESDDAESKNKQEHITDRIHQIDVRQSKRATPTRHDSSNNAKQEEYMGDAEDGEDTAPGHRNGGSGGGGQTTTPVTRDNLGEHKRQYESLELDRVILIRGQQPGEYFIKIVPKVSIDRGQIRISLVGESRQEPVKLLSASALGVDLPVRGSKIEGLKFVAGKALPVKIMIDFDDYCAMEVHAYGCT